MRVRHCACPEIDIFDDRLEITNPGTLPPELPLERLTQPHDSFPYNPVLAEVLFQTKFLEKWGTGVKRIMDVCRANNVPAPTWSCDHGQFKVTFPRVNPLVNRHGNDIAERQNDHEGRQSNDHVDRQSNIVNFKVILLNDNEKVRSDDKAFRQSNDHAFRQSNEHADRQSNEHANDIAVAILAFCMIPRSRRAIFTHLGLKWHTDNFNKYVRPLIQEGLLELTQPDSPRSPTQKYVTHLSVPMRY